MAAIMSVCVLPELQLAQGDLLSVAYSCNLHFSVSGHNTISLAMVLLLQRGICSCLEHATFYSASDAMIVLALMKAAAAQGTENICGLFPFLFWAPTVAGALI